MAGGLDVIIIDDDPTICRLLEQIVRKFYSWGKIFTFHEVGEAVSFCRSEDFVAAVFVLDVFVGEQTCFTFLEEIEDRFPMVYQDTIVITGNASDDVVNACVAADINHLLEKPVRPYALQLAVRAILSKYLKFAKKLMEDPSFAEFVTQL